MTIGCGTVPAFQHSQFIGEVMLWNMKAVLAGVVMVRDLSRMLMLTDGKLGEAVGEMPASAFVERRRLFDSGDDPSVLGSTLTASSAARRNMVRRWR